MTTSIGVEHVAPHVREWTCRRIVRCPPYADENTEQQNPYRVYQQCLAKGEISDGLYMAHIRPIYGLYTAYIWPIYGLYMAYTRPIAGLYTAYIRPIYGLYTAYSRPIYGL